MDFDRNFDYMANQTTTNTRLAYAERFMTFCGHLPQKDLYFKLRTLIYDIEQKRANGDLKLNSLRQYKGALSLCLSAVASESANTNFYNSIKQSISYNQAKELYEQVYKWRFEEKDSLSKQLDNIAHLNGKTSSHKLKCFPVEILNELNKTQRPKLIRLQLFVNANIKLGLRPNEWFDAYITDSKSIENDNNFIAAKNTTSKDALIKENDAAALGVNSNKILVVKNSKNTHERACGSHRFLILDDLSDVDYACVEMWLKWVGELKNSNNMAESQFAEYLNLMQRQLLYFCVNNSTVSKFITSEYRYQMRLYRNKKRLHKINGKGVFLQKPPIELYPALYSTRHQAVADAKMTGMNPAIIAAIFGHASVLTAENHYGKAHRGHGKSRVKPHYVTVNKVVSGLTNHQKRKALISISSPTQKVQTPVKINRPRNG